MIRPLAALLAALATASGAAAQPGNLPLSPGVHPGSPIGPGTQFLPQPAPRFSVGGGAMRGGTFRPKPAPFFAPGPFVPGYNPFFGFGLGGGLPVEVVVPPVIIQVPGAAPAAPPAPTVILANEFPATLAVQFPAPAEVWLNGRKVGGDPKAEHILVSPVLKQGEQFRFELKARWTAGGKTYEAVRTVPVAAGERSRLVLVSGTEVK